MANELRRARREHLLRTYKCIANPMLLKVYGQDMFAHTRRAPELVVVPSTVEEFESLCHYLFRARIAFLVRGSGTNYTGGVVPGRNCTVVVVTTRLCRIVSLDPTVPCALVEPGLINDELNAQLRPYQLLFPPDPSSSRVCTIGGNIAENAGGPNGLFYGVTHDYILALEVLLADGRKMIVGDHPDAAGPPSLRSMFIASEGTLCVILRAWLRLVALEPLRTCIEIRLPDNQTAVAAAELLIRNGCDPVLLELLAEPEVPQSLAKCGELKPIILAAWHQATLCSATLAALESIKRSCGATIAPVQSDARTRRAELISKRRAAAQAAYQLGEKVSLLDAVVPRRNLPAIMRGIAVVAQTFDLVIMNSFHAGDGNIHPLFFFSTDAQATRVEAAKIDILRQCVALDGSIAAEHGIGLEKKVMMAEMFSSASLRLMHDVKVRFDAASLLNPGKMI